MKQPFEYLTTKRPTLPSMLLIKSVIIRTVTDVQIGRGLEGKILDVILLKLNKSEIVKLWKS